MVLEETNRLDKIMADKDGNFVLIIIDLGLTKDPKERLKKLLAKMQIYAEFICSDDFKKKAPGYDPKNAEIAVWCSVEPPKEMQKINSYVLKDKKGKKLLEIPVAILLLPQAI